MSFKTHDGLNRLHELERMLNAFMREIQDTRRERKRLDDALRRLQIAYMETEMEYSEMIHDPIDNSALITRLKKELEENEQP